MADIISWPVIPRSTAHMVADYRRRRKIELLNDTPINLGETEDDRMDRALMLEAEMVRRKLVAIRGVAFAERVLRAELAAIVGADCQQEG